MMEAEGILVERTSRLILKPRINVYYRMQKWKKVTYTEHEKKFLTY
jgi:hypothetical protein